MLNVMGVLVVMGMLAVLDMLIVMACWGLWMHYQHRLSGNIAQGLQKRSHSKNFATENDMTLQLRNIEHLWHFLEFVLYVQIFGWNVRICTRPPLFARDMMSEGSCFFHIVCD